MAKEDFTHFDAAGNARMVDISSKPDTIRKAVASGTITMSQAGYSQVRAGMTAKGDVLGVARLAGIMAAKKVDDLIPLTHALPISSIEIDFGFDNLKRTITINAQVKITGKTGVEMEALTAVAVSALTIYDMCKAVDKGMVISNIRLLSKSGGKSGTYKSINRKSGD